MFNEQNVNVQGYESNFQQHLTKTFIYMTLGLVVTAITAFFVYQDFMNYGMVYDFLVSNPYSIYFILLAEVGLVMFLSFRIAKMKLSTAVIAFAVYSVLNGLTFGILPIVYDLNSIYIAFLMTAAMFASMSIIGLTTKIDLTRFGSLFGVGLVVMILVALVGVFMNLSAFELIFSFVGLVLFLGLTAYDMQRIRQYYLSVQGDAQMEQKTAIYGALQLYLDFINIFLYILRIMGKGNKK